MIDRWAPYLCVVAVLTMASGCASTPADTVEAYFDAVKRDDPQAAWRLLSPDARADLTYETFERDWGDYRAGLPEALAITPAAALRATVRDGDRSLLELRLTSKGWRITGRPLAGHLQETPRDALVGFLRAMEHRDYAALMTYVPARYAEHMDAASLAESVERNSDEIDDMTEMLRSNLDNPIEQRANRAYMEYGPKRVVFVKEGEVWKIDDPDEATAPY